jgi:hypothetical protein
MNDIKEKEQLHRRDERTGIAATLCSPFGEYKNDTEISRDCSKHNKKIMFNIRFFIIFTAQKLYRIFLYVAKQITKQNLFTLIKPKKDNDHIDSAVKSIYIYVYTYHIN